MAIRSVVGVEAGRRARRGAAASAAEARPPRGPRASASGALPAAPGDPAPVRVPAVDRRLDQRRRDHGAGDRARVGVVGGPGDLAGEQRGGALAVGRLLASEVAGDRLDRGGRAPPRAAASVAASAAPALPDASRNTVSLVLVSPSTESWSQVRAAAPRRSAWSVAGSAVASVRTTESIVAMRGWIIPTPLAMPGHRDLDRAAAGRRQGRDGRRRRLRRRVGRPQRRGRRLERRVRRREAAATTRAIAAPRPVAPAGGCR